MDVLPIDLLLHIINLELLQILRIFAHEHPKLNKEKNKKNKIYKMKYFLLRMAAQLTNLTINIYRYFC